MPVTAESLNEVELTDTSAVNAITWVGRATSGGLDHSSGPLVSHLRPAYVVLYRSAGGATMLFTIAVILLVLWLLGLVSGYTLGNFIYVLLVIALVLFVVGLVSGRRTV
jgi:uncharacterized membrane protein YtjA (UPF0391 family)